MSRRSFYEHFENKEECLLATYDALIERLTARIVEAYDPEEEWTRSDRGDRARRCSKPPATVPTPRG